MARKAPPKAAKKAARKAAPKTAKAAAPRRPAQIPKAQWDKLGASTRKRYAGYFKKHPDATTQQARGHKEPREAARRREKAEDFIESYALQQAARERGADFYEIEAITREFVRVHGMAALRKVAKARDELNRRYREGKSKPLDVSLADIFDEYDVPEELLWYH